MKHFLLNGYQKKKKNFMEMGRRVKKQVFHMI